MKLIFFAAVIASMCAQAEQRNVVGFAGLGVDGVAEKQQQVHLVAGDAGRDLLAAALHPGETWSTTLCTTFER